MQRVEKYHAVVNEEGRVFALFIFFAVSRGTAKNKQKTLGIIGISYTIKWGRG